MIITTIAGTGTQGFSGDGGPATTAQIYCESGGVTVDAAGNVYFADEYNRRIRKISPAGIITTVAGTGSGSFSGGGYPASSTSIGNPVGIAFDGAGNLYVGDILDAHILKINTAGIITSVAGSGLGPSSGDGIPATAALIGAPYGIAFDGAGNMYFSDYATSIRMVNTSGIISTLAGKLDTQGYSGDGGPATAAELFDPSGIAIDGTGNVYLADRGNCRIREVNTSGVISTIAGTGTYGFSDDGGAATSAKLGDPTGVIIDTSGNLYIDDWANDRIRKVDASGIISTIAGGGSTLGDGCAATAASLSLPYAIAMDEAGNIYINDYTHYRIRKISRDAVPWFVNGHSQGITVCESSGAVSINAPLAIHDSDANQTETWSVLVAPAHGTAAVAYTATSTGDTLTPTGLYYTPTAGYTGSDSFRVSVIDCGGASDTTTIHVVVSPPPPAITGVANLCAGATAALSDTTTGGAWSSGATGIATVTATTGSVTGVSAGTATIAYSVSMSCGTGITSIIVTVNPSPSVITGTVPIAMGICTGATTTLNDAVTGGAWSSGNTAVATTGTSTGVVTGVSPGTAIITYTLTDGCSPAIIVVTVNPLPLVITGAVNVCTGATISLGDATSGGAWSSLNPGIATTGTSTGVVTGVTSGITTISYTLTSGCAVTSTVTVSPSPSPVTGTSSLCAGTTIALSAGSAGSLSGGVWSSSNTSIATVGSAGSPSTGIVGGVAGGTATVYYTLPAGCNSSAVITVLPSPSAIGGVLSTCIGATAALSDTITGGYWTSSNTSVATIDPIFGIVMGAATGTATISYTIPIAIGTTGSLPTGCTATTMVTVNVEPLPISGTLSLCTGNTTDLSDGIGGGSWSSSGIGVATVDGSGNVHGVSAGTAIISYSVGTCVVTAIVTVNTSPPAISGVTEVCVGLATLLTDGTTTGTWSTSNAAVASIVGATGILTGGGAGTATISYTLPDGCATTRTETVNTTPPAITGVMLACPGATTLLIDAGGGSWSSGNTAVASVSSAGVVGGITVGTASINYAIGAGCATSVVVTVNPLPAPISGTMVLCAGATTLLSDATGTWSSGNTGVATAGSTSGIVSGVAGGTANITYTSGSTGCSAHTTLTINPLPLTITGALAVCQGATTLLSDHTTGGVWSSSATTIATVSAGAVSGVAAGTAVIVYTIPATGCATHSTVTINPLPLAITGTFSICAGATTALLDATSGGVWTSAAVSAATIGSVSGAVSGVSAGTAVVSYTIPIAIGTTGCVRTATLTVNAIPAITGPTAECVGAVIGESIPIAVGTTGGTWSSSVTTVATVGSSGSVTGIATGTTVLTYTSPVGCKASTTITVSLSPGGIIGALPIAIGMCAGDTTTLSDAVGGGVWSSSNSAAATVGSLSGTVTGVAVGTTVMTYSLGSTGCTVTKILTVNAAPAGITGTTSLCAGAATMLADVTTGGAWTTSGGGIATVIPIAIGAGMVTGIAAGTATITYTHGGCSVSTTVTVNLTPTAITGPGSVCAGDSIALGDGIAGGVWTSSNTVVATVDAGGYATGLSPATATITYSLGAGCAVTKTITVNPISAITGSLGICLGTTSALSDAATGGAWSSSASAIASVNTRGIITGALPGTSVITYTIPIAIGTGCAATAVVTANLAPSAISGVLYVCAGAATSLGNTAGGGLWTSGNTAVATVGSTGIVTGIIPGTATITYSLGSGCIVAAIVTVDAVPSGITGTVPIAIGMCAGTTSALSDASTGGAWSSGSSTIATVSGTGIVSGVSAGTVAISYRFATGCAATATITVNPLPAPIAGTALLCAGLTTTLASTTTGGAWSSSSTSVATADPVLGIITGVIPGTAVITYTLPSGCSTVATATINAAPAAITGGMAVCIGSGASLADPSGGGIWSSSNTGVAIVSAGVAGVGAVTGIGSGTATISYTVGGCPAMAIVTINSLPGAISGTGLCVGSTETLTDLPGGGTWSSSDAGIATIDAVEGIVTGISAGTAAIAYSLGAGCTVTAAVTVDALPGAITGAPEVCLGYVTTLIDPTGGGSGVWSSSNTAIATVSATGAVGGVAGGPVTISYTSRSTGCAATRLVTVVAVPAITGVSSMCAFSTVMDVSDSLPGGTWTSTSVTVSTAGVVTPYSAGAASLTYTIPLGCYTTTSFTVHPLPGPVMGGSRFCRGGSTILADTSSGGIWSSSNSAVAPVNTAGLVSGLSQGTAIISYALSTGCMETTVITVDSFPVMGTITGLSSVCSGATITLADVPAGGAWSSTLTAVATVSGTGILSGASAGVDTIKYTLSNTCGTASTSKTITVNPQPIVYTVTGGGDYCAGGSGVHIGLSGSGTGITYQLYLGATFLSSAAGIGIAVDFGLQTAAGIYTVVAANSITGCTINMPGSATVAITPAVIPAVSIAPGTGDTICSGAAVTFTATPLNGGSTPAYRWLVNNIAIPGATTGVYTYIPVNGDQVKAMLTSSATCAAPATVSDSAVIAVVTPAVLTVTISASPGTNIQQGQSDTLTAIIFGSGISPVYQWEINGNPVAGATMVSFANNYYANDTVTCIVSVGRICNSEGTGSVVILVNNVGVNTLPTGELITIVPNPSNGTFTIKGSLGTSNEQVSLEISDLLGESIYQGTIVAPGGNINTQLSLASALANGVYILRLKSGETAHVYRIAVAR